VAPVGAFEPVNLTLVLCTLITTVGTTVVVLVSRRNRREIRAVHADLRTIVTSLRPPDPAPGDDEEESGEG
jgi:hypothetical protein